MNNRIARAVRLLLILLAVCMLTAAMNAPAQARAQFSVPFPFTVNNHLIPAGDYTVGFWTGASATKDFMAFFDRKTLKTYLIMVRPEGGQKLEQTGYLVFTSIGSDYRLKEVQLPWNETRAKLRLPRSFTEQIARNNAPVVATIQIASR